MTRPQPFTFPTCEDPEAERLHRKQRLAAAFRLFARFGFEEGVAGHITARDPESHELLWVNPFGMSFKHIRVSDLICVDTHGEVVHGSWPVNRAAFAIHSQVHQARPDIVAAAHTHSVHGRALSALGQTIAPITQDACAFFNDNVLYDDFTGVVNETAEGAKIAQALGHHKAAVLQNHGLLTVGGSVEAAAWWFITMERSAQVQLIAQSAGTPIQIADEVAARTYAQVGTELAGVFQFHPLWSWITDAEPDLLD